MEYTTAVAVADGCFSLHPDPMWIFDRRSLRFLAVNEAATATLGYSRGEFLALTVADIRPEDDQKKIRAAVDGIVTEEVEGGTWPLLKKSGETLHASVHWRTVRFEGEDAVLASVRDVTKLVEAMRDRERLLREAEALRRSADAGSKFFRSLVEGEPGKSLALHPHGFQILAASDAFLSFWNIGRMDVVGRRIQEVFPYVVARSIGDSLSRVLLTGRPDRMTVQRHVMLAHDSPEAAMEDRYWFATTTPIRAADGEVLCLFHRVEEVTEIVRGEGLEAVKAAATAPAERLSLLAHSAALSSDNQRLIQQDAILRAAQRLLRVGSWTLDPETGQIEWSEAVQEIFGIDPAWFEPTLENCTSLVHPDDLEATRAAHGAFAKSGASAYEYQHRVVRPDGSIIHVRGMLERGRGLNDRKLVGVVQDVTEQVLNYQELEQASHLVRLAGSVARLGGWRVNLDPEEVIWTAQTAEIHEAPHGTSRTFEQAIGYLAQDSQPAVRRAFTRCVESGVPFDEVVRMTTEKGRPIWARVIGEAQKDASGKIVAVQGAFQDVTDSVYAKQATERTEGQLVATLEHMSDAFYTLDRGWRFTYLNGQAERLLERSRGDLIGKIVWEEFPEAAGTQVQTVYEDVVATGRTTKFEQYYPPLRKWFRMAVYPAPDGLAVYFSDSTEERARSEHLQLLETAVARLNDIVLITEAEPIDAPDGPKIVYVNDAFVRRTGYSRGEVIGRTPLILQGPKTDRLELDRIRQALEKWRPVRAELINYTKTGEEFWLELNIVPIANETGWYTHWIAVERDVTDRKQAEHALRLSEERFRLVANATDAVVWDYDLVAGTMWCSANFATIFGYAADGRQPFMETWKPKVHPDDAARVLEGFQRAIDGSNRQWQARYRYRRADGRYVNVIDRGYFIRDAAGVATRIVGSLSDVTAEMEEEMRRRQSQKLEAMGQLTGGVAHDFNNLLTVILGNAELLSERIVNEKERKLAEATAATAERGAALIGRMLAFARRQPLQPRVADLNALVASMGELLRRTLSDDISIEAVGARDLWQVEIDPNQFEAALLNLSINARDAMPGGGKLTIETSNILLDEAYADAHDDVAAGEYVQLAVTDTGTGMTRETAERAFEPFFSTKEEGSGSGLGLSMVFGFVKQTGGHVKIYSEPGEGTTFRLYFPRKVGAEMQEQPQRSGSAVVGGTEHILVAEDDVAVRGHLVEQLRDLGYRVTAASNGREAYELLQRDPAIDLLFTDVVMPGGMNGRALADAAQRLRPELKVLFTSGYTENAIIHNGRLDAGVELLSKPYRQRDLAAKVRKVLDDRQQP